MPALVSCLSFTVHCYALNAEHGILSVRLSMTLRYRGHRLEYFKNNCMADYPRVFTFCTLQHHGSTPSGSSENSRWIRVG